jgi:hypothetical protein
MTRGGLYLTQYYGNLERRPETCFLVSVVPGNVIFNLGSEANVTPGCLTKTQLFPVAATCFLQRILGYEYPNINIENTVARAPPHSTCHIRIPDTGLVAVRLTMYPCSFRNSKATCFFCL